MYREFDHSIDRSFDPSTLARTRCRTTLAARAARAAAAANRRGRQKGRRTCKHTIHQQRTPPPSLDALLIVGLSRQTAQRPREPTHALPQPPPLVARKNVGLGHRRRRGPAEEGR